MLTIWKLVELLSVLCVPQLSVASEEGNNKVAETLCCLTLGTLSAGVQGIKDGEGRTVFQHSTED